MSLINIIIILQLSHSLFIIYHNLIITWARDGHNNHKNIISVTHCIGPASCVFSKDTDFIYAWDACEWWEKDSILNVYKEKNRNEFVNIGLIHFSDEACGLFSQLVWSLGQNFDAWSTAPINTPHPLKMGFSNSLINIRHFWYLKYSRGGTNSHIFLLQHKWVQCQIFFTFYLHTHLLFWRSWIDPVMKHLGVFTFRITSARHQAPGTRPDLGWGYKGLYFRIVTFQFSPRPWRACEVWAARSGTWYIWDIYTTGAFASKGDEAIKSKKSYNTYLLYIQHNI